MKLLSFLDGNRESWGAVVENGVVDLGSALPQYPVLADFLGSDDYARREAIVAGQKPTMALSDVKYLPVIPRPEKIVCAVRNYLDHHQEAVAHGMQREITAFPPIFLRVWRSLPSFGHRAQLSTWLFQVAKNVILDSLRARDSRPRTTELVPEVTPATLDASVEQSETIRELWCAVEGLSLDLRTALLLRDVVGLSYNEIADTLDVSLVTVKWRIYKAREHVQLELSALGAQLDAAATG
jgi:RNA polymerase sigma factor (sigma-70 family)